MRRTLLLASRVVIASCALVATASVAQQVIATVPVGGFFSWVLAVNTVTNKTYVAIANNNLMTVIDGLTLATTNVTIGSNPAAIGVNPLTNKIYVSSGAEDTVTVVDGLTLATSTIPVGRYPDSMGIDSITNNIYTGNLGNSVTVIDGVTNGTTTVQLTSDALALAVNPITNKIYVAVADDTVVIIDGATLSTRSIPVVASLLAVNTVTNTIYAVSTFSDRLTVIDGTTLHTVTIPTGQSPSDVEVNLVTNVIYVANSADNTVTAIDGTSLSETTIPVGQGPAVIGIDSVRNKIYVGNNSDNTVTVIDANNNRSVGLMVGGSPEHIAVNEVTNRIYVSNFTGGTVSVIAGADPTPLQFVPVTPCRVVDTRNPDGTFGGPPIQGGTYRSFPIPQGSCDIPSTAVAYSLNVTVVPDGPLGYLTIWPTGQVQPVVSTMNSSDGRVKANAAIVPAGSSGSVSVYATNTTNLLLDINGYFTAPGVETLQFYPLTPCRIVDTRHGQDGGSLQAGVERDYSIPATCGVPDNAAAYSFNVTAVPSNGALDYLSVWPQGELRPTVSTLNNNTGTIVANAAVVPAGSNNTTAFYAHNNDTDLLLDVDGYFAAPGANGLSLHTTPPCRVLDTRNGNGQPFSGTLSPPVDVVHSACAPPNTAQAFVFNATVVPSGRLGYLTLWPDGEGQPVVSTLNAVDGAITSNMAIVPNLNGKIDAYAAGLTQLILDISAYFAP
jgi:YVTN family beta-propeller protein